MNRWLTASVGGSVALAVVCGIVLYVERGPVAERLARRWLADHGAADSDLDIRALSLTGFSARVRLGSPADPDLVVDRMDVRYAVAGPWARGKLGLRTAAITLVHPRLTVRYVNGTVSFGALDGVIEALERLPRSTEPLPDVVVVNGEARLLTAGGEVRAHGGGSLRSGTLIVFQGQIDAFHLRSEGQAVDSGGGGFDVESLAGRLKLRLRQSGVAAADRAGSLKAARLTLSAETPYPTDPAALSGPASLAVDATGVAGRIGQVAFDGTSLAASFAGILDATRARQGLRGLVQARGEAASIAAGAALTRHIALDATLSNVDLGHGAGGLSVAAAAKVGVTAEEVRAPGWRLKSIASRMRSQRLVLNTGKTGPAVSGVILGSLAGSGAASGPAGEQPYLTAVRRGLADFRFSAANWKLGISSGGDSAVLLTPLTIATKSGASVVVSAHARPASASPSSASPSSASPSSATGGAHVTIGGGGLPTLEIDASNAVITNAGGAADVVVRGTADAAPAKGVGFRVVGHGVWRGGDGRFSLADCAQLGIERLTLDPYDIEKASARLCPADKPLIEMTSRGWRLSGRFDGLSADAPGQLVTLRGFDGALAATGSAKGLATASLRLDRGEILDTATPTRFEALTARGHMDVGRGLATGLVDIGLVKGPPLATITVGHALATGAGRADIESPTLRFTRAGLQPTRISPLASAMRNADGAVKVAVWLSWARGQSLRGGGEARATALDFSSPAGPVVGLDADLHFTSLMPLVTAPDQIVTIRQIQAFVPVSAFAARFDLDAKRLNLIAAGGAVAKGRVELEPMRVPLASDAVVRGAIVVHGIDLGEVLAATSLSDAVKTNAVVRGRIPFEAGPNGLTIRHGELASEKAGRISISRAALTGPIAGTPIAGIPVAKPGFAEDLAYQAMDNLAFDSLDAAINSQANDRLGVLFHIKGRHDPPTRHKASLAVKDILSGHALDKPLDLPSNTKIDLTLDTSLNFGDLVKALAQAWREALAPSAERGHSEGVQSQAAKRPIP